MASILSRSARVTKGFCSVWLHPWLTTLVASMSAILLAEKGFSLNRYFLQCIRRVGIPKTNQWRASTPGVLLVKKAKLRESQNLGFMAPMELLDLKVVVRSSG